MISMINFWVAKHLVDAFLILVLYIVLIILWMLFK